MSKLVDMTGKRFGRLTVIERAGTYIPKDDPDTCRATWLCKCDCGNLTVVIGNNLRAGFTKSCGCLRREESAKRARRKTSVLEARQA